MTALKVMPVEEWVSYKKEFKNLMREIEELNGMVAEKETGKAAGGKGCLVKLEDVPENTTKANIRIFVSNFEKPEYVDYKRGNSYAVIRFASSAIADNFIQACLKKDKVLTLGKSEIKFKKLNLEEEDEYLLLAEKHKREFKEYCATKRKKKKVDH